MFSHNSHSCPGKCQFIQDRRDADRYTCLPCGKVRYTSDSNLLEPFFAVLLAVAVVAIFLSGCSVNPSTRSDVSTDDRVENAQSRRSLS